MPFAQDWGMRGTDFGTWKSSHSPGGSVSAGAAMDALCVHAWSIGAWRVGSLKSVQYVAAAGGGESVSGVGCAQVRESSAALAGTLKSAQGGGAAEGGALSVLVSRLVDQDWSKRAGAKLGASIGARGTTI
jgi:hypothetical protein